MSLSKFTPTKPNGQPRKPRTQAEFRSVYVSDLMQVAETNGVTLTNVPSLPIRAPTSRTGRKALRKSFDADCRRLRRESGAPARTGPPVPNSERQGHRRFYSLEQCRRGARLSGIARRDQAMPRWAKIQALHYKRYSTRSIARQVGMSHSQVHRVVTMRLWTGEGPQQTPPPLVVVNSARGTPLPWSRVLALGAVYLSRWKSADKMLELFSQRQRAYVGGIERNGGPDYAAAIVGATKDYVQTLAHMDVALAVRTVNEDSGYYRKGIHPRGARGARR